VASDAQNVQDVLRIFRSEVQKNTKMMTKRASALLLSHFPRIVSNELSGYSDGEDRERVLRSIPDFFRQLDALVPSGHIMTVDHIALALKQMAKPASQSSIPGDLYWPYNVLSAWVNRNPDRF
jgi:hypothetical protein